MTRCGCFSRNGDSNLVHGLGDLRNCVKEWAATDVPFNAVEGSLFSIPILTS